MTEQQRKSMQEEKYLKMIRDSEDFYDTIDSELKTRKELQERQVIMNETRLPKRQDSINPIHIVYDKIKAHINDFKKFGKTPITGMGGVQMQDSDRFSTKNKK